VNQLMHGNKLADASFKTIVTPNVDTVYSQAWHDLSREPNSARIASERELKTQNGDRR